MVVCRTSGHWTTGCQQKIIINRNTKTKIIKTTKNKIIKRLVLGQSRADTRLTKVLALLEKGELLELLCGVTILFLWGGASRETFKDVETAPARFQFFEGLPSNDDVKNVSRMVYPTRECLRNYLQKARELSAKF